MSDLIQSLIASGMEPPAAVRVSKAIQSLIPKPVDTDAIVTKAASRAAASVQVPQATKASEPEAVQPTTFSGSIETRQSATFSGDSQFSGGLSIDGEVNWNGTPVAPASVSAIGGLGIVNGSLHFQPTQMAALSDLGPGKPQRISFACAPASTGKFLTSVTPNVGTVNISVPTGYVFVPTTASVTLATGYTFNANSCTISPSGTVTITYVTGGIITSTGTADVEAINSITLSTTSDSAWTGASGAVSATGIEDPA